MELRITGKNINLSPTVRQYIERKLGKLGRHLPRILACKVEISQEKTKSPRQHFVVQVTLDSTGTLLRGEERGQDLLEAIDKVAQTMDRQVERYKGRRYRKNRGSSPVKNGFGEEMEATEPQGKLVKVKRFPVKPMPVAEAIEQMELLGHDFFLFFNAESDTLNLIYRREDGDYGLIEPVLG